MTIGLPVSTLVSVSISLTPPGAQFANFDSALIVGDSNVIDVVQRLRTYVDLAQVATDFGSSAPEYLAAADYFGQTPSPETLYIGRWAHSPTNGLLVGGRLSAANQLVSAWTPIADGAFNVFVDGVGPTNIGNLDFSAQTNFNGIANVITSGFPGGVAICTWDAVNERFIITSQTTGATSAVSFLAAPNAGTDISGKMAMQAASSGAYVANGIAAETAVAAVVALDTQVPTQWYALTFAAGASNADISDADHLAIAAYIEGAGNPHVYGVTTSEAAALNQPDTTSIGAQLKALGYHRTFCQWSSTSAFAVASMIGRMCAVDFNAANTAITLMYQQEPGVAAETLTQTQAAALNASNYNYFVNFNNATSIIVNGKAVSGQFIDTVWGVDWLADAIQTNVYNALYTAGTKIPQTDAGNNRLMGAIESGCVQGVANGLLAPGTWNAGGFGQIVAGSFLPKGYYIYAPPIATQSETARAARQSVPFQVAAKLAGAIHTVDVALNINP